MALVELALVLPVLVLLLFGLLDFGKAINGWINATHLANQAARFAAVNKNPGTGTLQQYIQQQAGSPELRNGGSTSVAQPLQVCLSFPGAGAVVGEPVRATVTFTYNWLPFISDRMGIAQTAVESTATMRMEALPSNYTAGCA